VTRLDKEADDYKAAIWVVATAGGEPKQLTSGASRDTSPRWSPDGKRLAFVSNRPPALPPPDPPPADAAGNTDGSPKPDRTDAPTESKTQVWLIEVGGGEARQLTNQRLGAAAPEWSPDGRTIAFLSRSGPEDDPTHRWLPPAPKPVADERIITDLRYRFDGRGFFERRHSHLWTIPSSGGEATQLTGGDTDDDELAWSPDGRLLAFVGNRTPDRGRNSVRGIYLVPAAGGEARPLVEIDGSFGAPVWSPDGTRLAFAGHREAGSSGQHAHLWTVAAGGGEPTDQTAAWDRSFDDAGMSDLFVAADQRPAWVADGASLLGLASDRGATHLHRVSLDGGAVTSVTAGSRRVASFAPLPDGRFVLLVGDSTQPFELVIVGENGDEERALTDHNRRFVEEVALVPAEEITCKSQAGDLDLQGWLLKPAGVVDGAGVRAPLILQIHGGPHAMYGHALFHEMQLMVARGYVVLFTNPRGSSGYGQEFATSTKGRWGESDLPDILGALDAAVALPFVDAARVGVTGGSYGGY
jgi:dipeptidyl aminopeptidase/acylaminoacyl peptidase